MKKVLAILMAVVLLFSIGTTALAANFTPSVEQKDAPTVVPPSQAVIKEEIKQQINEQDTVAVIVHTETDKVAKEIHESKLIITSVANKDTSTEIPAEAKKDLDKAYEDFSAKNKKISQVIPADVNKAITNTVKEEIGAEKTADDLIVRDLFDVTLICDESNELLVDDAHHLLLTFSLGIKKDEFITVIKFNPEKDKWETIRSVVNNGDGTVTCEFDHLCPIAFLVEKTASNSAQTGDDSVSIYVWIAVAAAAAALIVVLIIAKSKKEKSAQ